MIRKLVRSIGLALALLALVTLMGAAVQLAAAEEPQDKNLEKQIAILSLNIETSIAKMAQEARPCANEEYAIKASYDFDWDQATKLSHAGGSFIVIKPDYDAMTFGATKHLAQLLV